MKSIKSMLAVVATALFSLSVTSCLNGDDDNTLPGMSVARVNGDIPVSFTDMYGTTIHPTQQILTAENDLAFLLYAYKQSDVNETEKTVKVTLWQDPVFFDIETIKDANESRDGNAPVITLQPMMDGYTFYPFGFFDKETLYFAAAYKAFRASDESGWDKEKALHSFELVYDPATAFDGQTLTLYFRHTLTDNGESVERTYGVLDYFAYNLQPIFNELGTPKTIKIKAKVNENSDEMSGATEKEFEFQYSTEE